MSLLEVSVRKQQHSGAWAQWQSLQVYATAQLDSNVFRYTHSLLGGIKGFQP